MVYDRIENAKDYYGLGKGIEQVLRYLESYDPAKHENGQVNLDGELVRVGASTYTTAPKPDAQLEAHREYVDVMFVAEGEEKYFYKPVKELEKINLPYDPKIDACLAVLDADSTPVRFKAGHFCIFLPQDAHCAGQLWDQPTEVKKLVAKVHVSKL